MIGYICIGAAFLFFLVAGILALLIRTQLALPGNIFLSPDSYNQIFTMHGTVMMFLFAVPAVKAMGILLLPQMLGAGDLPFPRLGAFRSGLTSSTASSSSARSSSILRRPAAGSCIRR